MKSLLVEVNRGIYREVEQLVHDDAFLQPRYIRYL